MAQPGSVPNNWKAEWYRLGEALSWRYGPERASVILAGRDPETNKDIARWRSLGERGK